MTVVNYGSADLQVRSKGKRNQRASAPRGIRKKETLRFEVKGQSYLLSFNPDEGRWYLLTPGIDGRVKAIPVRSDEEIGITFNLVVPSGDEGQASVN
jgi:hypothetical protein